MARCRQHCIWPFLAVILGGLLLPTDEVSAQPAPDGAADTVVVDSAATAVDSSDVVEEDEPPSLTLEELAQNYPFLMPVWRDLKGMSSDEQLEAVKATAVTYLRMLSEGTSRTIDAEEATQLNTRWQLEKEREDEEQLDMLSHKRDVFRVAFQDYIASAQSLENLGRRISYDADRVQQLEKRISYAQQEARQFEDLRSQITDSFRSRLANIPMVVVAVGRIRVGRADVPAGLYKAAVTAQMLSVAVSEVIGKQITLVDEVHNDIIKSSIVSEERGKARVTDSYYMDSQKLIEHSDPGTGPPIPYHYQIHRINVYPFNKSGPSRPAVHDGGSQASGQQGQAEVFFDYARPELMLLPAERAFCDAQTQIALRTNRRVNESIRAFRKHYEDKFLEYQEGLNGALETIASLKVQKAQLLDRIDSSRKQKQDFETGLETTRQRYRSAKEEYKEFYQSKTGYIHYFQQRGPYGSPDTEEDHIKEMVEATWPGREPREGSLRTTVLIEIPGEEGRPATMTVTGDTISYEPRLDGFRILYLTRVSVEGTANYLLNIAYRINWRSKKRLEVKGDTLVAMVESDDGEKYYAWQLASGFRTDGSPKNASFLRAELLAEDWFAGDWRLPKHGELVLLSRMVREEVFAGSLYSSLRWPVEGLYLTSETEDVLYKACSVPNEQSKLIERGADAFVLRVRELGDTEIRD